MRNRNLLLLACALFALPAFAAPSVVYQPTILPQSDNHFDLGTSTQAWRIGYFGELCLTGDTCLTTWPGGGSGGFSTTSADYWLTQQSTSDLVEGSNLYFTNTRADARFVTDLAATTSVSSITALPSLSLPYSQLTGTPTIPTKTSDLTNDSGFITSYTETDPIFVASQAHNITATDITHLGNLSGTNTGDQDLSAYALTASLAAVATSGAYSDLTGTPDLSGYFTLSSWYATTSAPQLTTLANLGTVKTSLSGLLKASSGVLSAAVSNTDFQAPVSLTTTGSSGAATFDGTTLNIPQYSGATYSATYPVTLTGSAFGLAFGTTTANTWGAKQTFDTTTSGDYSVYVYNRAFDGNGIAALLGGAGSSGIAGLFSNTGTGKAIQTNYGDNLFNYLSGKTGIATVTPWGLLSVTANGLAAGTPQFVVGSSTGTNFIVANNGNVGVASTSPSQKLSVTGNALISGIATGIVSSVNGLLQDLTISSGFSLTSNTLSQVEHRSFTYATSTAWTGTTTIPIETGYGEVFNSVRCFTDAGTLGVDFYHSTSHLNYIPTASTTNNVNTFSTNNTITSGDKTYVDIGTPASSPTKINCTVADTY